MVNTSVNVLWKFGKQHIYTDGDSYVTTTILLCKSDVCYFASLIKKEMISYACLYYKTFYIVKL